MGARWAGGLSWQLGGKTLPLDRPRVMAALNATPDSFYPGSRLPGAVGPSPTDHFGSTSSRDGSQSLRQRLKAVLAERPDIVDVGGQSARPGSERVAVNEELARVVPVIRMLRELHADLLLSVDTYSAVVAEAALDAGADIVNDISAGRLDPDLQPLVAQRGCGYVLMHMQGLPENMQREPHYEDCLAEVQAFLETQLAGLLELGIAREQIAVDPGIGFGKRLSDNLDLIRGAARFHALGCPLLYGVSRKSFIGMLPHVNSAASDADGRLPATLAATWALLERGVMLHRVHDVSAVRQVFALWEALGSTA